MKVQYERIEELNKHIVTYWSEMISNTPWVFGQGKVTGEDWLNAWQKGLETGSEFLSNFLQTSFHLMADSYDQSRSYREEIADKITEAWNNYNLRLGYQEKCATEFINDVTESFARKMQPDLNNSQPNSVSSGDL